MKRRLLNLLTALSLLLCVAVVAFWVRSRQAGDGWQLPPVRAATPAGRRVHKNSDGWWTNRLVASVDGRLIFARYDAEWMRWPGVPDPRAVPWQYVTTERRARNRIDRQFLMPPRPGLQGLRRWRVPGVAEYYAFPTQVVPPPGAPAGLSGGTLVGGTGHLSVSWAAVLVPLCVLPAVRGWRWLRRRRFAGGLCPSCGYDLRATPGRCPECGWGASGVG